MRMNRGTGTTAVWDGCVGACVRRLVHAERLAYWQVEELSCLLLMASDGFWSLQMASDGVGLRRIASDCV